MAKTPKKSGQQWSPADVRKLKNLASGNTPTGLIAWELDRSVPAVRAKASEKNISLKPTNQKPYNRRKQS